MNKKQLFVSSLIFFSFMETCFERITDSMGNHQRELPRDDVFHTSIMSVACQSFSPKIFVKTL